MNPIVSTIYEEDDILKFTLSGVNVSLANAIRRTILSDIQTVAFVTSVKSETDDQKCIIYKNTSRMNNEIVKMRLGCIPIHLTNLSAPITDYIMEVDVQNTSDETMYVTTEHFKIRNKTDDSYLSDDKVKAIFPPNKITGHYIDFIRLRPAIGNKVEGESIKMTCEFSLSTAREDSMYNVVGCCLYTNTIDVSRANSAWKEKEKKLIEDGVLKDAIEMAHENFQLMDAQRIFLPDSFDFVVETVGVFDNKYIVSEACNVLLQKFAGLEKEVDEGSIKIIKSNSTIQNSYDVILENEDYTIGKVLEYILYNRHYEGDETFTYCGFKKFHPHDTYSVIRIAFKTQSPSTDEIHMYLKQSIHMAKDIYQKIKNNFKE